MKLEFLLLSFLYFFVMLSCNKSTTEPPDDPQGYQKDIPWPSLADSPWPMSRHDPQGTGRSKYVGPKTSNIQWEKNITGGIFSGPVLTSEGNIVFGTYWGADSLFCLNDSGKIIFAKTSGGKYSLRSGILIAADGTIYLGDWIGKFFSFDKNGNYKWSYAAGSDVSQANINCDLNGNLYFTSSDGYLHSLTAGGTLRWKKYYGNGFKQQSPLLSVKGDRIIIQSFKNELYSLDLNGNILWQYPTGGRNLAQPLIDNSNNIYLIDEGTPKKIISLNSNGNKRWDYVFDYSTNIMDMRSSPCIDKFGNISFLGNDTVGNFSILSLDYLGKLRWTFKLTEINFSQPFICDDQGNIYLGSSSGEYYYAVSNKGELLWKRPLNGAQVDNAGAIAIDGTLYIGTHGSNEKLIKFK